MWNADRGGGGSVDSDSKQHTISELLCNARHRAQQAVGGVR